MTGRIENQNFQHFHVKTTNLCYKITFLFRPARCSKKYERIFIEWDRMERAFLQPCGFYDPEIPMGGPPRKGIDLFRQNILEYSDPLTIF